MSSGSAQRAKIIDLDGLASLIEKLSSREALALGALRPGLPDHVRIVSKHRLAGLAKPNVIARTADNIAYLSGRPAFALLDFDTKGMTSEVSARLDAAGGFWQAIVSVLPELTSVARVSRSSTSAGLFRSDTHQPMRGSNGLHVYLLVRDGTDIERFLKTLHERCWLAGFGWMMVGAAGQLLERSIVDRMVWAPERLVFEGAPLLELPLKQDRAVRRPIVSHGGALDTTGTCPTLTILEKTTLRELRAKEAHRLSRDVATSRATFIASQTKKLVERRGMAAEVAEQVARQWQNGVLLPDVVLPFDDGELSGVTVGDVLADPARFEGATLADPLEGVEYGRCKAKVLRREDGTPWIRSFAHGGAEYELRLDLRSIRTQMEKASDDSAIDTLLRLALASALDEDEFEKLAKYAAGRTGIGIRTIVRTFKAKREQKAKQRADEDHRRRLAKRADSRPQIERPRLDAEWLPQMQVLNGVLGRASAQLPPMRNIDGDLTQVRARTVPNTHAFTSQDANAEQGENL
jgi:hypothetical protein